MRQGGGLDQGGACGEEVKLPRILQIGVSEVAVTGRGCWQRFRGEDGDISV